MITVRNVAIGTVTLLTAFLLYFGYQPRWLFVDWTNTEAVPFPVHGKIEIASRWYPLKRSSMSLLCGPGGLHLMLKSRLPMPQYVRDNMRTSKAFTSHTAITFDWVRLPRGMVIHSFETKSALLDLGSVDTIVTRTLTSNDQALLMDWFRRGAPQGISLGAFESGAGKLKARAESQAVAAFFERCASRHADPEIEPNARS